MRGSAEPYSILPPHPPPPSLFPPLSPYLRRQVFGICETDLKIGQEGSAVIHPTSRFYAGKRERELGTVEGAAPRERLRERTAQGEK